MVRRRAATSGGMSLIPIPGVDIAGDVGLLLQLIPAINRKFGLTPEQIEELDPRHKVLIYAMLKQVGGGMVGIMLGRPKGLIGRLYWWVLLPIHAVIWKQMTRRMADIATRRSEFSKRR